METIDTRSKLTGALILLLLLYAFIPWVSENTSNDLTPLLGPLAGFTVLVAALIWINHIMLDDSLDGKLLHTTQGKRELLWRLAEHKAVKRQGWPWWVGSVVVWLGYRGAFFYAVVLTWITMPFGQPLFVLTGFSIPTLLASVLFLVTRLGFENWAKAHPETVDSLLNTPKVQDMVEQNRQGA